MRAKLIKSLMQGMNFQMYYCCFLPGSPLPSRPPFRGRDTFPEGEGYLIRVPNMIGGRTIKKAPQCCEALYFGMFSILKKLRLIVQRLRNEENLAPLTLRLIVQRLRASNNF